MLKNFDEFRKAYQIRNIEAGGQFYGNYATLAAAYSHERDFQLHER